MTADRRVVLSLLLSVLVWAKCAPVAQAQAHGIPESEVVGKVMLAPAAIKRLIEPAEVAALVGYLCGPDAGFITGESIMMDGGWSAR